MAKKGGTEILREPGTGRWLKGTKAGPGRSKGTIRVCEIVKDSDLESIVRAVLAKAKNGDMIAAKEIFNRCEGLSKQFLELQAEVFAGEVVIDLSQTRNQGADYD